MTPTQPTSELVKDPKTSHGLQCMEIWGSNRAADTGISTPGLDLWVYSRPHEHAEKGGDVHYVSLCGGGIVTRFILADVSGHGDSVGAIGQSLRNLMRRYINRKNQVQLVKDLNRQFTEHAKMQRFATAIVGTYLTTGDKLAICNAGHPRPCWYRASTGKWSILASPEKDKAGGVSNLPLGIDHRVSFTQLEIVLDKGDFVLFYTDALTEATSSDGQQLGETGLLGLLQSLSLVDSTKVAAALLARLNDYRGAKAPADDLTFLLLHHNGGNSPRLSFGQKLDVYAKFFGLKKI